MEKRVIEVVTQKGKNVVIRWDKKHKEYRAFHDDLDMKLGAIKPESLAEYVRERY